MIEGVDPQAAMKMATDIVIAYLDKRSVEPGELPALVRSVRSALTLELESSEGAHEIAVPEGRLETLRPAVPIEESVTRDYLVSLEDGKHYRSLRRHLMAKHGMTPDDYRRKWNLPSDYPMVAPSYAEERSAVARRTGLGRAAPAAPPKKGRAQRQ